MINMINHHHHHNNNSSGGNFSEKMQRTQEYIEALEEERRKIQVFQRELPLCFELVTQAIDTCKQQLSVTNEYNFHGQSECSEQTSTEGPVLEEFIPLKRCSSSDDDELQSHKTKKNGNSKERLDGKNNDKASLKKSDWLRSVQLWNQTPDPPAKEESPRKIPVVEVKSNGNGGAFHPFKKDKSVGTSAAAAATQPAVTSGRSSGPAAAASSTADTGGSNGGGSGGGGGGECKKEEKEKEGQSHRKARRCWSPELHKRFLMALQQLGGSHVATPKQIRELMKVDGLTNDEVKSHLQKYRLHNNRRPSSSIHNNNNPQAPQFVVVGGIWVPPSEYAVMGTNTGSGEASGGAKSNGIYAPIATLASPLQDASVSIKQRQQHKQSHSDDQASHSGGVHHSRNSPVTSSSTDTTTASPTY